MSPESRRPTLEEFKAEHQPPDFLESVDVHVREVVWKLNQLDWVETYASSEAQPLVTREGYINLIARPAQVPKLLNLLRLVKQDRPYTRMDLLVDWDVSGKGTLPFDRVPAGYVPLKWIFFVLRQYEFFMDVVVALEKCEAGKVALVYNAEGEDITEQASPTIEEFKQEYQEPGFLEKCDPGIQSVVQAFNQSAWALTYGSCEGHAITHKEGYVAMIVKPDGVEKLMKILVVIQDKYPHTPMHLKINWDPAEKDSLAPQQIPPDFPVSLKWTFFSLHLEDFVRDVETAIRRSR